MEFFWHTLLKWHSTNYRDFPWRKTTDPFHILIAEFLLQQTDAHKVQNIYSKIITLYSTPKLLAAANLSDIQKLIIPLGLHYRAQRLKNCAEIICKDYKGIVPNDSKLLRKLPGVGPYISEAVLCYAYGLTCIPIDTNVIRVFGKYFDVVSNKTRPRTDISLAKRIREFFTSQNTRPLNLAILDFAATICTAKKPKCNNCPIMIGCKNKPEPQEKR